MTVNVCEEERIVRITEIRAAGLSGATPKGGWAAELRPADVVHTVLAVHTDEGIIGLGSVFTNEALVRASLEVLAPFYVGENPLEPERVSETLHQQTFWLGRGGAVTHTISGIDTALWDVLGQATGQPVGRLLGGHHRSRVRPYASLLMSEPARLSEHLHELSDAGFRAFKIGWGSFGRVDTATDEAMVRSARAAVSDRALLAVDAGGSEAYWPHDLKWALRTAHMLADYGIAWFEEALRPDALEDFTALRSASPVAIAGGEVLTRRQAFTPYLQARAFDIVQPDSTKAGGLSESRRIGRMAEDFGIKLIPHGWNTGIGLATDLHLASALPLTDLVEYVTGSPYVDELTEDGFALDDDGMLAVPDTPGLGVRLNSDALARYSPGNTLLNT